MDHTTLSMDKISSIVALYGMNIVGAAVILLIGKWLVGIGARVLKKVMLHSKVDETLASFAANAIYFLGLAFVVIAALGQLGIQTTSLAAVLGAAGLAVALSLQGSLGNLASGVMIIGTHPFKIGDTVEIAGKTGKVVAIDIFATELRSDDNKRVIIPNGKITGDIIINQNTGA
jgi:small conductance mechanosensitive channel